MLMRRLMASSDSCNILSPWRRRRRRRRMVGKKET